MNLCKNLPTPMVGIAKAGIHTMQKGADTLSEKSARSEHFGFLAKTHLSNGELFRDYRKQFVS